MDTKERSEFYEKLYFYALESRNSIDARLRMPLTIFAFVTAMLLFLFKEVSLGGKSMPWHYWSLFLFACIFMGFSIFYFIKVWHGYTYKLIPVPDALENYYGDICTKCRAAEIAGEEGSAETWAKEFFDEYLFSTFKGYASHNLENNQRKLYYLHRTSTCVISAFLLSIFAYIPYYFPMTVSASINQRDAQMSPKPDTPPPPPPAQDVKGQPTTSR